MAQLTAQLKRDFGATIQEQVIPKVEVGNYGNAIAIIKPIIHEWTPYLAKGGGPQLASMIYHLKLAVLLLDDHEQQEPEVALRSLHRAVFQATSTDIPARTANTDDFLAMRRAVILQDELTAWEQEQGDEPTVKSPKVIEHGAIEKFYDQIVPLDGFSAPDCVDLVVNELAPLGSRAAAFAVLSLTHDYLDSTFIQGGVVQNEGGLSMYLGWRGNGAWNQLIPAYKTWLPRQTPIIISLHVVGGDQLLLDVNGRTAIAALDAVDVVASGPGVRVQNAKVTVYPNA